MDFLKNLITKLIFALNLVSVSQIAGAVYESGRNGGNGREITEKNASAQALQAIKNENMSLLADLVKYYKKQGIDINEPVDVLGRKYDLLGAAISWGKVKAAKFLLSNGAKLKDEFEIKSVKTAPLIYTKSMAELLIPRGVIVPKIKDVIDKMRADSLTKMLDVKETGLALIKFLVGHGAEFDRTVINSINAAIQDLIADENHVFVNNSKHFQEDYSAEFKAIKKYLDEKLKNRN